MKTLGGQVDRPARDADEGNRARTTALGPRLLLGAKACDGAPGSACLKSLDLDPSPVRLLRTPFKRVPHVCP